MQQESLDDLICAEEDQVRFEEYNLLGQDKQLCDIEYAIHAQAEVMLDDPAY